MKNRRSRKYLPPDGWPRHEEKYLHEACDGLYDVFGSHHKHARIEGCPCCVSPDDEDALERALRRPLRELGWAELNAFAWSVALTWGDCDDFRFVLPRLFELAAWHGDDEHAPDLAMIFSRLRFCRWPEWPEHERDALNRFLRAFWRFALTRPADERGSVEEALCCVGGATDDIEPLLCDWIEPPRVSALANMSAWLRSGRALQDAFWEGTPRQRVRRWLGELRGQEAQRNLENAFFAAGDAELQGAISDALEAIAWWGPGQAEFY